MSLVSNVKKTAVAYDRTRYMECVVLSEADCSEPLKQVLINNVGDDGGCDEASASEVLMAESEEPVILLMHDISSSCDCNVTRLIVARSI
jgi:hypothetical protein